MIFQLSWDYYEESHVYLFEAFNKTPKQFEEDCDKAMFECFDSCLASVSEEDWIGMREWVDAASFKLEEYGYKKIVPYCKWYGGDLIVREEEAESNIHPQFKEQFKKMIAHNKIVEESLYRKDV